MNWKLWTLSNPVKPEPLSSLVATKKHIFRGIIERQVLDMNDLRLATIRFGQMVWFAIEPIFSLEMLYVLIGCGIIALGLLL